MCDLIQNDGGGCSRHIVEWLDAQPFGPTANDGASTDGEDDQGFINRLYQLCVHTLQDFCRQQRNQRSSKSFYHALRECLGRLYLWGEPFGVGELDQALEQSDELRDSVIERLGHIGKLLLRSKTLNPQMGFADIPNRIRTVDYSRELLRTAYDEITTSISQG